MQAESVPSLFVEGVRMRPTAEKALAAIAAISGQPGYFQPGVATAVIAAVCGHSEHVVRARLCDLRRLGLVESCKCRMNDEPSDLSRHYGHMLTSKGARRVPLCLAGSSEPQSVPVACA